MQWDPYETLKMLDRRLTEQECNLIQYTKNQKILDAKLNDIAVALKVMPRENVGPCESLDPYHVTEHSECFDYDHSKLKLNSQGLKAMINRLGKKR